MHWKQTQLNCPNNLLNEVNERTSPHNYDWTDRHYRHAKPNDRQKLTNSWMCTKTIHQMAKQTKRNDSPSVIEWMYEQPQLCLNNTDNRVAPPWTGTKTAGGTQYGINENNCIKRLPPEYICWLGLSMVWDCLIELLIWIIFIIIWIFFW